MNKRYLHEKKRVLLSVHRQVKRLTNITEKRILFIENGIKTVIKTINKQSEPWRKL